VGLMRNQFDVLISWIRCGLILKNVASCQVKTQVLASRNLEKGLVY